MKATRLLLLIMIFCLGIVSRNFAESGEGTSGSVSLSSQGGITGFVKDAQTGSAIANATIIITTSTGLTYQTFSNPSGIFFYSLMPTGPFSISVTSQGYQPINQAVNTSAGCYFKAFTLFSVSSNFISINDELTIYANSIVEGPVSKYTLSGNVNINGILYFTGQVVVDKRPSLYYPEISGNCGYYAADIQGADVPFKTSSLAFCYYADDNTLNPKSFAHIIDGVMFIGGFNVTLGQFIIAEDGSDIEVKVIAKMPFPIDKILEFIQEEADTPFGFIQEVSFSDTYSKIDGRYSAGSISDLSCNFGVFAIEDGNLYFNTQYQVFGGGFKLRIPGRTQLNPETSSKKANMDSLQSIPVLLKSTEGTTIDTTSFAELIKNKQFFDPEFFKAGVQVEFVSGEINQLILTLGVKIPIAATGLFITELTGGVENLVNKDDWRIIASIDVETGLEVPVLGSPIKLNDFGVNIHPLNYLKGSGSFEVFGYEVSDGYIEYDGRKRSLSGESNLNIADMMIGKTYLNVRYHEFSGGGEFTFKTPSDLPWYLNWAENIVLSSAEASIYNFDIKTQNRYMGLSIAQRYEFGKQGFPWFHYYIGTDYDHLVQIWKGTKSGKSAIQFQVPENCPQFFVVAGDTLNFNAIDFQLTAPDGKIYDSSWTNYNQFPESHQTMMVIDRPTPGDWTFLCSDSSDVRVEFLIQNQLPTGLIAQPFKKGAKSNNITLDFSDYADTVDVKVFYDTDRKHHDGSFIQEFQVLNNANLSFEWQNQDIPDGEYFIYCMIDDHKSAPIMQYAPGSIIINHTGFSEVPQNMVITQVGDSLRGQWDLSADPDIRFTTVYLEDLSTKRTAEITVMDTNVAYLYGLKPGRGYRISCLFIKANGIKGPRSASQEFIFQAPAGVNNPPYFTNNPEIFWKLIADESSTFTLTAGDADSNSLTFALPGDTLGITVTGNQLQWTPTNEQRGVYNLMLTVSDNIAADTTYLQVVVYTQEQAGVAVSFSSVNLYEDDNKFVKIRNYRSSANSITVTVANMNSGAQIDVNCRKVDEFEYIGKFDLSFVNKSAVPVANGDSLILTYIYNGQTYTALAKYDSLPQPSDNIPPAVITDLSVENMGSNLFKLKWTATGNDDTIGRAYKYDLRFSYSAIAHDTIYLVANRIIQFPYPSLPGNLDSLLIQLDTLPGIPQQDSVWFAVKAEDENQNRSNLSNSPFIACRLAPTNLTASVQNIYNVQLDWQENRAAGFQHYAVYRKTPAENYSLITDTVSIGTYTDNLFAAADALYQYAIQAVYSNGSSDTVYSNEIDIQRFTDLLILCQLEDTSVYDSVSFTMQGLDTIYSMSFNRTTNLTGLVLLDEVYVGTYILNISKPGYQGIQDTITINYNNPSLSYTLLSMSMPRLISGKLEYDNDVLTPLDSVRVYLYNEADILLDSTITNTNGEFSFSVPPGEYHLAFTSTNSFGGVNSVDALLIMKHFVQIANLYGIRLQSADVDGGGYVNAIDALLAMKRFTQLITSFAVGDWLFENAIISIIPGENAQKVIKGLCFGDVNGSYVP